METTHAWITLPRAFIHDNAGCIMNIIHIQSNDYPYQYLYG